MDGGVRFLGIMTLYGLAMAPVAAYACREWRLYAKLCREENEKTRAGQTR